MSNVTSISDYKRPKKPASNGPVKTASTSSKAYPFYAVTREQIMRPSILRIYRARRTPKTVFVWIDEYNWERALPLRTHHVWLFEHQQDAWAFLRHQWKLKEAHQSYLEFQREMIKAKDVYERAFKELVSECPPEGR